MTTTNALLGFDVTATATETTAPERRPLASNLYPFRTKRAIKAQIAEDQGFANLCLLVIHARQTEAEKATKETISQNGVGFMSSHSKNGTKLAQAVLAGCRLNPDDQEMIRKIAGSYSKQLAEHFRAEELAKNPALKAQAKVFGL
jgi:hypothetical protein